MARDYARIMTAIWDNRAFLALGEAEQRAYLLLVTQPDISAAGVLSLRVRRWSSMSSSSAADALGQSLKILESSRFVVIDHTTEELLIRSFIKWDAGFNNPKRKPVIVRAREEARSELIREHLDVEFARCGLTPPPPPPNGGERAPHADIPSGTASDRPADSLSAPDAREGSRDPVPQLDSLSDPNALEDGVVVAYPQSSLPNPPDADASVDAPEPKRTASKRRTQLPKNWKPTDSHVEYTTQNGIDLEHEAEQFRLHAEATERRMANWNAAFRQWLGNTKQWQPKRGHLHAVPAAIPADPDAALADLRDRTDAVTAAKLIGTYWPQPSQPPRDPLPYPEYARRARLAFIDENADRIREALARKQAG